MYELITGNVPFKGDNAVEIALKHMKDKIPSIRKQDPSIPQSVENILLKATAKNPRNRYESAKEMHEDLLQCLEEEHSNDKKISFEYPEDDIDSTTPSGTLNNKKKIETSHNISKNENTEELVKEVKEEKNNNNDDIDDDSFFEEPKKRNTLIIILTIFFLLLLITGGIFWLVTTQEVEDVIVPNINGLSVEEAIEKLTKAGFTYTTEQAKSDKVEEGYVIKSTPRAGSTRKKGETITIIESIGGSYYYLEDYTNKNINEVKAKLEFYKIKVVVEKKDVEDKEKYKNKENIIIDQSPKFDSDAEKKLINEGDTITLYIPNIVNEYPNMVEEGWSLSDVLAFIKEYNINLTVIDKLNTNIPEDKYHDYAGATIIEQSRPAGDAIIEGITLRVKLNTEYSNKKENNENNNIINENEIKND